MSFTPSFSPFLTEVLIFFIILSSTPLCLFMRLCQASFLCLSLHLCQRAPVTQRALPQIKVWPWEFDQIKRAERKEERKRGREKGQRIKGSNKRKATTVPVFFPSFFFVMLFSFVLSLENSFGSLWKSISATLCFSFSSFIPRFLLISLQHISQNF